jgi:hypothetical protein
MKLCNLLKLAPVASLAAASALSLGLAPAQAAITTFGCASAPQCTLAELFAGGGIQIDDKFFGGWVNPIAPDPIDYSQVVVTPLDDDPLNPGLQYDWDDQIIGSGVNVSAGSLFTFFVSIVDGHLRIKDNSLELLNYEVTGGGSVLVFEIPADSNGDAFLDPITGDELIKFVGADINQKILFSDVEFPPQLAIQVVTMAMGQTDQTGGTFALRKFEQRFSQVHVPEGSSVWSLLLGAGALGAGSAISNFLKSKRK